MTYLYLLRDEQRAYGLAAVYFRYIDVARRRLLPLMFTVYSRLSEEYAIGWINEETI